MSPSTQAPPRQQQSTGARTTPKQSGTRRIIPIVTGSNRTLVGNAASSQYGYTHRVWQRSSEMPQPQVVPPRHRHAILQRRLARRVPWTVAAGTAGCAALSWGMTTLWTETLGMGQYVVPAACAGLPLAIFGAVVPLTSKTRIGRHTPEWAAGTLAAAGLTYWTGVTGPSWAIAAVAFVALVVCSARWWLAHPVGPLTPSIAPAPQQETAPATRRTGPVELVDTYAADWDHHVAPKNGLLPGSHIVRSSTTEQDGVLHYRVNLCRGQTFDDLDAVVGKLASALGLPRQAVSVHPSSSFEPESVAYLDILTGEQVSELRYYPGPQVSITRNSGTARCRGRFIDGRDELEITMWTKDGCRSVGIVGEMGSGKSAAANELVTDALSTGRFNLAYIDPKGNSSTALRKRARLAFIGQDAAMRAPELIEALAQARAQYATTVVEKDVLLPTPEEPGWVMLHDEFSSILIGKEGSKVRERWSSLANRARAYGFWQIFVNQMLQAAKWGDDATRAALLQQLVAFRILSSSDTLAPGMSYRPFDLPSDAAGNSIPGWATCTGVNRNNVPVLWDMLPRDDDEDHNESAPYTISSAFDAFFDQPALLDAERAVLEAVLGPPNENGTWIVGLGGTHTMPEPDELQKRLGKQKPQPQRSSAHRSRSSAPLGVPPAEEDAEEDAEDNGGDGERELTRPQREVLEIVRGGTTRTRDIVHAAKAGEKSVHQALTKLVSEGLLNRPSYGHYEAT